MMKTVMPLGNLFDLPRLTIALGQESLMSQPAVSPKSCSSSPATMSKFKTDVTQIQRRCESIEAQLQQACARTQLHNASIEHKAVTQVGHMTCVLDCK